MKDYLDEPIINPNTGKPFKMGDTQLGWTYQGAIRLLALRSEQLKSAKVGPAYTEEVIKHLRDNIIFRLQEAIKFYELNPQYIQKANDSHRIIESQRQREDAEGEMQQPS